jgi:inosose dehydratase
MLSRAKVKVGVQPINWINDDFRDLGAGTTLEQCLSEMKEAGYEGTELGHRFPADGAAIRALLARFDLSLASGWHSTYLASRSYEEEEQRFDQHLRRLKEAGSELVIVAECTRAIHGDGKAPLSFGPGRVLLATDEQRRVYEGLDRLAQRAAAEGMKVAYHEHMGTVFQDASDVDALMANTTTLGLLLDTGHLRFAGADPLAVLERHGARVSHVHLKNIRQDVVDDVRRHGRSFEAAVRAGAFTVPGDEAGAIDYVPLFEALARLAYQGWLVVEAEQDPKNANPLEYARHARAYLRAVAGV